MTCYSATNQPAVVVDSRNHIHSTTLDIATVSAVCRLHCRSPGVGACTLCRRRINRAYRFGANKSSNRCCSSVAIINNSLISNTHELFNIILQLYFRLRMFLRVCNNYALCKCIKLFMQHNFVFILALHRPTHAWMKYTPGTGQ